MRLASHEQLRAVQAAAITAGLAREVLLTGLPSVVVASLPIAPTHAAQLLMDLDALNQIGVLMDGSVPLELWLKTAAVLAGPREESKVFEEALAGLQAKTSDQRRGAAAPSPVPPEGAARVVVFYAAADEPYARTLFNHLRSLERSGRLTVWSRDHVLPGARMARDAEAALTVAHLVVVLVSADFLATDALVEDALDAQRRGKRMLAVLVRPCLLEGTPFEGSVVLPRSGRALSAHRSPEDAYVEIVQAIEAAADAARRQNGRDSPPASPRTVGKPAVLPRPLVGKRIDEVFRRNGVPQATFVAPDQFEDVVFSLHALGRPLVIEGPTQAGKSTVVKKALETPALAGVPRRTIRCQSFAAAEELAAVLREGERLVGHVVIEDAHHLLDPQRFDPSVLRRLADVMKILADVDEPPGKLTLLGVSRVRWSFAEALPDLSDRMDVISMTAQRPELIRELVEKGQAAANVELTAAAEIVAQSLGSFRLAQEICYQLVHEAGIRGVPEAKVVIDTPPDAVRARVASGLAAELEAPMVKVAAADQGTARPGACLAMLALLAVAPDLTVPIGAAWEQYPHLEPSFRWIQEGNLEKLITADLSIASILSYRAGALSAHDPRLRYHLQGLSWVRFAQLVGPFDIQQTPGQPVGIAPRSKPGGGGPAPLGAYAWTDENGILLHKLLLAAYDDAAAARHLLRTASVDLSGVADAAPAVFWADALDAAAKQGKLRSLLRRAIEDPLIAAYHGAIQRSATALGYA